MLKCWDKAPEDRPTFAEIEMQLDIFWKERFASGASTEEEGEAFRGEEDGEDKYQTSSGPRDSNYNVEITSKPKLELELQHNNYV